MKSYTIGREENSNIIISDPSKMVSRHHATLTVNGTKMTIMDHSSNGTFINGIKISSNTPVPVTRKDVVSFANIYDLDWNRIPNPANKIVAICCSAFIAIAAIVAATYYVVQHKEDVQDDITSAEEAKAKEIERLTNEIKQFKVDLDTLEIRHKDVVERLTKINELCDKKVDGKELKEITKTIGNIESEVKGVDLLALRNSIERVEENLKDNVSDTPARVQAVSENIKKYKTSITKISKSLSQIEEDIKRIKNKPVAPPKKEKDEPKKEKNDTILNPTILM